MPLFTRNVYMTPLETGDTQYGEEGTDLEVCMGQQDRIHITHLRDDGLCDAKYVPIDTMKKCAQCAGAIENVKLVRTNKKNV